MTTAPIRLGGERIVQGCGSIEYLKQLHGKRAAVFSTNSIVKNGYYERIISLLDSAGIESEGYLKFRLNPSFEDVQDGADFLKELHADIVVAAGGGTVMDAAKVMWVLYENPQLKTFESVIENMDNLSLGGNAVFVCIPTTSGSGSEVSKSGVITDSRDHRKVPIRNLMMVPNIAILDPEITLSLPKVLTAETGIDALTHHLESLVSPKANMISDAIAYSGALEVVRWLPKAYDNGENLESRERMMLCSTMGGLAFSAASLGLSHGIAHAIGAKVNLPHGLINAILLPIVIRFNSSHKIAREKYSTVAKALGEDDLSAIVQRLGKMLSIPDTMQKAMNDDRLFEEKLEEMANDSLQDGLTILNCVRPDKDDMIRILHEAYYGTDKHAN
ncbi:MAG: iron-containing alcohol dehydrogenase [Anaerolineaceae bacterium]|nr:MAG: iron-containing alcohol dehydrogenase [Anaerolineaceae bacterium]